LCFCETSMNIFHKFVYISVLKTIFCHHADGVSIPDRIFVYRWVVCDHDPMG
jgi:hypothetical protein